MAISSHTRIDTEFAALKDVETTDDLISAGGRIEPMDLLGEDSSLKRCRFPD